ncbi:PREDICTED: cingulin-like [Dinoponera quadriceps]|uniref:Cingulin-like n=1 Tax=Dinoponera quadriceps TaxID=609295 RepID=A0A6P3XA01_DINQU|nr:PREDICTED: cingulin-like [Dinoponera quadriceps]
MSERYLDDYLPVMAIDVAVEEKARVAEMAAATLRKLHNVMQQMKNWRDGSVRLKSNIWRMKMVLRADDKNGDDNQETDPLIAHQRAEISRLEEANDALGNEVASLRRVLTQAEVDNACITGHEAGDEVIGAESPDEKKGERRSNEIPCRKWQQRSKEEETEETRLILRRLGDRLEEFKIGDRAFEAMIKNTVGRVVETIVSLSEELVNVHEDLCRFRRKNKNLHRKLGRLRAMLRSRSGNSAEYRRRIGELKKLAEQLVAGMARLKMIRENCDGSSNAADIPDVVAHVGRLMDDLRNNLKSEREAMIAAGDPDRLRYMKKVVDLKISLRMLAVGLRRSDSSMRPFGKERHATASLLSGFLAKIDTEIGKLRVTPMDRYCRIGGVSGARFMRKVTELEDMVRKSATVIAERPMRELGEWIERLCRKMQDLELLDDRASLRIGRLEASIVRMRLQLAEKDERVRALGDQCASVKLTSEEERGKYERIVAEAHRENERLRADEREREISELSRVHAEMRLTTVEIDALRKKLRELRDDKEALLGETERARNILRERDKEIANIITGRDPLRAVLEAEVKDLKTKLGVASDENVKLKSIIGGLGKRRERQRPEDKLKSSASERSDEQRRWRRDNGEGSREDRARNLGDELERLKAESNESKIRLDEANGRIERLEGALAEALGDRARLLAEVSDLKSNEQSLTYRLNVQTSAGEQAAREYERANKAFEGEVEHLREEKEQLEAELSELRLEKGSLAESMADADNKCAALQERVNGFRSECDGLRGEVTEAEAVAGDLRLELERARAALEDAAVEAARLNADNSSLAGELDLLRAARSAEVDDRVRVLLAEKNELATRINELDDENAGLRDRLNKAKAENEYFSMELNKSRVENDKAGAKNRLPRVTRDVGCKASEGLRGERDEARRRLNEIGGEMAGDRRKIRRTADERSATPPAAALHRENNDREGHSKGIDTPRYPLAKARFADAHNKVRHKQDCSDAVRTGMKVEIGEQKDDETALKAESDTCASPDNKAKIKQEPKAGPKRPRVENKALKLESANSGSEKADVAMELASCAEVESGSPIRSGELGDEEVIDCLPSKRRELVNIRYARRMSNYAGYSGDSKMLGDKEGSRLSDIDQLEVENRALKMEVDVLRGVLDFGLTDSERMRRDLAEAKEEIRALKSELMNLRDERASLRSRLDSSAEELDGLRSERMALKDELVASRKSNFDFRLKTNDLRSVVERLKGTNARLEDGLRNALRETSNAASPKLSSTAAWEIFSETSAAARRQIYGQSRTD